MNQSTKESERAGRVEAQERCVTGPWLQHEVAHALRINQAVGLKRRALELPAGLDALGHFAA